MANFTSILITTDEFLLDSTLRDRARIHCRFEYYSVKDLAEIVFHRARIKGWKLQSNEIAMMIARRAKGTPGQAIDKILYECWWLTKYCYGSNVITVQNAYLVFSMLHLDDEGLDERDRSYLEVLLEQNSTPLSVISAKLRLSPLTIQRIIEPYLMKAGFAARDRSGHRMITDKGKQHMNNTSPKSRL